MNERVILRPTVFQGASARYLSTCRTELINIRQQIYLLSKKAHFLEKEIVRVEGEKDAKASV